MLKNKRYKVVENESGELTDIPSFVTKWLDGDGITAQHANDDITVVNPTC